MRPVPVWFTGSWEERRQDTGKLSDFLIQRSQSARACLDTHLKPVGQSAEADEAVWPSATLHTAAWIENLTRPLIYWQPLTTQHIATSPEPVPQCKQIGAGWASSRPHGSLLCMPWASLRICTAPCRVLLASSWEYFIFQDPGFPRYKFKFLAKLYISLYYINERCTGTFSWYTTYCSQVVHHCLSKEKASTTKFCQFQGENEEPFSKGFTPDSHCSL